MSKRFPDLKSDEEAEAWLQGADLTEYDLSDMKKVRFELARKDVSISLRLPAALLATLKAEAARANMPTQRLIRMMIEAQLAEPTAPKRRAAGKTTRAQGRRGKLGGLRRRCGLGQSAVTRRGSGIGYGASTARPPWLVRSSAFPGPGRLHGLAQRGDGLPVAKNRAVRCRRRARSGFTRLSHSVAITGPSRPRSRSR
jgi:predicted DNA binding CopG/RHH family protein